MELAILNKLFTSKIRVKILNLLLLNSEDKYYLRQIESIIKHPVRGIQKELYNLTNLGIVKKEYEGNRNYYRINKKCPIFNELRSLFLKYSALSEILKEKLSEYDIDYAFIYGSYAMGTERKGSDVDLFIIGNATSKIISTMLSDINEIFYREINYVIFSKKEFLKKYRLNNNFIKTISKNKKLFLIGNENEFKRFIKSR